MSDKSTVSSAVSPWRVADRQSLLDAFLQANLGGKDGVAWLRQKIGLGAAGSREYGRWVGDPKKSDEAIGRDFAKLQVLFRKLIDAMPDVLDSAKRIKSNHEAAREGARQVRRRFGRQLDSLVNLLADVRLDFIRETYEGGVPENAALRQVLISFGRTSTRRIPLALDWSSESLAGELALACAERLCQARVSGRCPVCGEIWITDDKRGKRKLCGKSTCAAAWRQRRRSPELPGSSTVRVRKFRRGARPGR